MIRAVHDIKPNFRFRQEDNTVVSEKYKQQSKQQSYSDSNDSLQVADEVKVLSRMGMLWGESHVEVDDSGFHFTLVFENHSGLKATIVARKNAAGENCGISWWVESEEAKKDAALVVGIFPGETSSQTDDLPQDICNELMNFYSEIATNICDSILHAAFLLWRVSLNRSDAAAVKGVHHPFHLYKTAYSIICTTS